jgi:hypothetical protein
LWSAAIGLAGKHGVYRVSRALHLDYKNLKRRQQEQAGVPGAREQETRFVELTVSPAREPAAQRLCECTIELENPRGAKMRVELNGPGLAGLASLCSAFWCAA